MKTLTINFDAVNNLVEKGGNFLFKKEAEDSIIKLLQLRDEIDGRIKEVKLAIEKAGKTVSPNFRGVKGEKLNATYRVFGEKYTYDKYNMPSEDFIKTVTFHKVESKKVDEYIDETGELPKGIVLKDRQPVISFSLTENDEETPPKLQSPVVLESGKGR